MLEANVKLCPHGFMEDEYCPTCLYVDHKPQGDLLKLEVSVTLSLEVEKHWKTEELAQAIDQYLNRYVDRPGWAPSTYYIREVHTDATTFHRSQAPKES